MRRLLAAVAACLLFGVAALATAAEDRMTWAVHVALASNHTYSALCEDLSPEQAR